MKTTGNKNPTATKLTQPILNQLEAFAQRADCADQFELHPVNPVHVLVAYSGGRDSTALLDAVVRLYKRNHQSLIQSVIAVHIHHGLSKNADAWAESCEAFCQKLGVTLRTEKVYVNRNAGLGVEAAARDARYRALKRIARETGSDVILMAHHADDRLETFLIEWMRGAGLEGLASIAERREIEGGEVTICRPWLQVSREDINKYVSRFRLPYVEDESNTDVAYLRNLIRNQILPVLDSARPGWRAAAARSIALLNDAAGIVQTVGTKDLQEVRAETKNAIEINTFLTLPLVRQALTLRTFLASAGIRAPSKVKLDDVLRQIRESHNDTNLMVRFGKKELRRWNDELVIRDAVPATRETVRDAQLQWKGETEISLPYWSGVLRIESCLEDEDGFDARALREGKLFVKTRKGGEKLKLYKLRPSRNLKQLYQEKKIASFERNDLPLIWLDDELIFAAGLGADIRFFADKDLVKERVRLIWVPDQSLLSEL